MITRTSIDAYYNLKDLGHRQEQVYHAIKELKSACNFDIANHLRMPINSITPRTNELVKKGYVEKAYVGKNKFTGTNSIYWKLKNNVDQTDLPLLSF